MADVALTKRAQRRNRHRLQAKSDRFRPNGSGRPSGTRSAGSRSNGSK